MEVVLLRELSRNFYKLIYYSVKGLKEIEIRLHVTVCIAHDIATPMQNSTQIP